MVNDFTMYVPISKIDEETRTVAGFATTEEIDKQNEVVDYNGSKEAFANWQGNIREMHEPKAVGKAVEILPNDDDKRVWVKAYISKGADDTWQKVKEGILTGFSIGGQTVHKTAQMIKDASTGSQKAITRITKYRLNELSLVDNPANPGCSFALVKVADGIPFQTEIVEDTRKIVINEAEDPLKAEIHEHRDKADSLTKKVLDNDELDKLSDESFGLVRRYKKDDMVIKERLLPMSDKVHAVRALAIMDKYNLTLDEKEAVLKKAQSILGSAFNTHVNRGGETEVSNIGLTKITEAMELVTKRLEALEKAFEGAFRPVPGAKEQPKESTYTPALNESAPQEAGAADGVQTQKPEGEVPATKAMDGNVTDAPAVQQSAAEAPKDPANVMPEVITQSAEQAVKPSAPEAGNHPSEVLPEAPADANAAVKPSAAEAGKSPETVTPETQPSTGAVPVKKTIKVDIEHNEEVKVEKTETKSENDIVKVEGEVESLRKQLGAITELLKRPMPRKRLIEKNSTDTNATSDAEFQQQMNEVLKWLGSGKPLTPEQEKVREQVINKSLDRKFGKAL